MKYLAICAAIAAAVATSVTFPAFAATRYMYDTIDDVRVAPLVETSWGQGEHLVQGAYNYYTPNHYVCGCVATAGSQIMRYWRFPTGAIAARSFMCTVDSVARECTMKGGTYDWANMPTNYVAGTTTDTDTEAEAIGKLVFDVGVAVSTGWNASGGGSRTANLLVAFTNTFGYASAAIAGRASGTGLSIDEMKRTILPSLDAGMPCVIGIGGANTAHSAVCDGYGYHEGELYLHVNMGQSIDATGAKFQNAWYRAPSNNPSDNGVSFWLGENGVGEQSWINPVIYNISPTAASGSSVVSGRILDASGNPVFGVKVRATSRAGVGAAATSNAKGIYALVLPAGEYRITAGAEGEYSRRIVKVVATEGTKRADGGAQNVVIGNQCDIDFVPASVVDEFVEYVEATGTQYVDTGVEGRAGTKAHFKFTTTEPYQNDQMILGSRSTGGSNRIYHTYLYSKGVPRVNIGYGTVYNRTTWLYAAPSIHVMQTEFTTNGTVKAVNNGYVADNKYSGAASVTSGCTLYAMACNTGGTADMFAKAKLHYMKIWASGEDGAYRLERSYVPCVKGGRAGLYDAVSKMVYYSQGSADFVAAVCAAKPAAERMDRSKLLIGAYCLQKNAKTDAHIKAIHDCGVDFIIGGLPASDRTTLDLFAKHGVGAIVDGVVPRWWAGVERSGKMRAANPPEKYAAGAAAFKDHPAIWAIDIGDEPSALDFPYYGDVVRQLNKAIPGMPLYLNLYPNYGNQLGTKTYAEHVDVYCREVPLDYISYDFYPYMANSRDTDRFLSKMYDNFIVVSEVCRRTKRSFWYVPQVNSRRRLAPTSENRLRFQAYAALSFGAEAITWACWCKGWWTNNVLDAAGRQTEQYGKLKRVNAELKCLGPHYMRFRNVATRFVGFAPDSPRRPRLPHSAAPDDPGYVKASNGAPLVVGEMVARDPASGERAFFVTAADDPADVHPAKFDIVFNVKAKRVEAFGGSGAIPVTSRPDGSCSVPLASCRGVLIVLH